MAFSGSFPQSRRARVICSRFIVGNISDNILITEGSMLGEETARGGGVESEVKGGVERGAGVNGAGREAAARGAKGSNRLSMEGLIEALPIEGLPVDRFDCNAEAGERAASGRGDKEGGEAWDSEGIAEGRGSDMSRECKADSTDPLYCLRAETIWLSE
jgi:hypothetical protein